MQNEGEELAILELDPAVVTAEGMMCFLSRVVSTERF